MPFTRRVEGKETLVETHTRNGAATWLRIQTKWLYVEDDSISFCRDLVDFIIVYRTADDPPVEAVARQLFPELAGRIEDALQWRTIEEFKRACR